MQRTLTLAVTMTTATAPLAAPTLAAATAAPKGFGYLRCPKCNEEAQITIDLDDLHTLTCRECEDEFNLADVRDLVAQAARWQKVLDFIALAPAAEGK